MSIYKGSHKIKDSERGVFVGSKNTNCLTYTPKNVILELNNGTLTLKKGSKFYKLDGTAITTNSDISLSRSDYGYNQQCLIFCDTSGIDISTTPALAICFSGSGAPALTTYQYMYYYRTDTNQMLWTSDYGANWVRRTFAETLPIAIATVGDSGWTSIDQIFDWCGYIGSTAFVLPGVKGLIPDGFNADGTYKSIEFEIDRVLTITRDWNVGTTIAQTVFIQDKGRVLGIANNYVKSKTMPTSNAYVIWYNPKENVLRYNNTGSDVTDISNYPVTDRLNIATTGLGNNTSAITSLTPYVAQPLTTAIPIKFIYNGSQLVYKWEPYEPNTVLLYGANTGTKTYILDAGLYQCCIVGGGWANRDNWSNAGGAAVEIQFRLTEKATVVVYSGGLGHTASLNINGVRVATANTASGQNSGGSYSIDTASPYYVSTVVARKGGNANLSVAGSVSPYGGWGAGTSAGGVRLEYITY